MSTTFQVNGADVPTPSVFNWTLQDISSPDAGRTLDGIMHKNQIAQKRKIQLQWNGITKDTVSTILNMFNSEYFDVTYLDPLDNAVETRTFYSGDKPTNLYSWRFGGLYESISFNIIEV